MINKRDNESHKNNQNQTSKNAPPKNILEELVISSKRTIEQKQGIQSSKGTFQTASTQRAATASAGLAQSKQKLESFVTPKKD